VRLYELAKALKINSKALVTCCQDLGSPVKNHMSVVSEEVWNQIQDRLKITGERRVVYVHEVPKVKKKATKKKATSVTKKNKKNTKTKTDADIEAVEDTSKTVAPVVEEEKKEVVSQKPVAKSRSRFEKKDKLKKENPGLVVVKKAPEKKGVIEKIKDNSLSATPANKGGLIRKKQNLEPQNVVIEEKQSDVDRLRQRELDRQGQREDRGPNSNRSRSRQAMQNRVASRRGRRRRHHVVVDKVNELTVQMPITMKQLSSEIKIRAQEMINRLHHHDGSTIGIDDYLEEDHLINVGLLYEVDITINKAVDREDEILDQAPIIEGEEPVEDIASVPRPPVVAILGHVDHGKTSLLDYIRESRVAAREAGGITQHIGAYQITRKDKKKITFIDTPGHQVFTEMRARGAQHTDLVVLVVAADDGVMPQTIESIQHIKAAGVQLIIAANKMDLPGANLEKLKQQLTQHELIPEDWGGDVIICPVSAHTGEGVDHLLDMILLQSEMMELKANPDLPQARGIVLESSKSNQKGVVATVLVQNGTLRKGEIIACGTAIGKIRALVDENQTQLNEVLPSRPVVVFGLDQAPEVGSQFNTVSDMAKARELADLRAERVKDVTVKQEKVKQENAEEFTLDAFFDAADKEETEGLSIVVKADVKGSLEALVAAIQGLDTAKVPIKIISKAVGGINESDVVLAKASEGIVVGFNVVADAKARKAAKSNKIEIRLYRVIYELLDEIKATMQGLVGSITREEEIGQAEVRGVFKSSKFGMITGCIVTDGVVRRGSNVRVSRNGTVIHYGRVESLRRFTEDVREVKDGFECGMRVKDYDDIKEGDSIHFFVDVEVAGVLE